MNPGLWIWLIAVATVSTLVCAYHGINRTVEATTYEATDARLPAILWDTGASVSLLVLLLTIFAA
ncbi:MAG: hypothetical protein IJZ68_08360 [Bacteroidaceae bacterium]|nr:hypothetical protein [Bacteroidaceae bacterium]